MKKRILKVVSFVAMGFILAGCTFVFQTGRRSDTQKIQELSQQLEELARSMRSLEDQLSQEIQDKQVKLQMMDKGLVITVVGDLVFDSGKAKIRAEAYPLLDKVSKILQNNFPNNNIAIEGHTDNVPIARSHWKSNWQLSSARALSVLEYLVTEKGISPDRLSANGYGEFQPVASNDTESGRQMNRRVEIVILPRLSKVKDSNVSGSESNITETQENLK